MDRSRGACKRFAIVVLSILACGACGDGDDGSAPPRVGVLSAVPAELAALVERASIDETMMVEDRVFRVGTLGGASVVLGMTGVGLVNAAMTTRLLLDHFDVAGVVVSGVAGSSERIGDVTVPATWALSDGTTFAADTEWLELAKGIAAPGTVALERCTLLVSMPSHEPVCMPFEPALVVGGIGRSSDPFHGQPFPCRPGSNDIYGCDITPEATSGAARHPRDAIEGALMVEPEVATTDDMETAAIAQEATAVGVPFIAFRAVSDGAGDPLHLTGFFAQFSAYYRFAAHNAAAATAAFLERLVDANRQAQ